MLVVRLLLLLLLLLLLAWEVGPVLAS